MILNYQYRCYPETPQKSQLNQWLRVCQYWYNYQLGDRFLWWENNRNTYIVPRGEFCYVSCSLPPLELRDKPSFYTQKKLLPDKKKDVIFVRHSGELLDFSLVPSQTLQDVSKNNFYLMMLIFSTILLLGCSPAIEFHSEPTLLAGQPETQAQMLPIGAQVSFGDQIIELEVTQTPQQQALGLMYRENLPDNQGMLFSFSPPRLVNFWMKNVKINLDMLFLYQGEIKAIADNVPPCKGTPCPTYGPPSLIDQVIELRGGRASELGLKVGDQVNVQFHQ